jgi:uncharacterized protein DUF642
LPDGDFSGGVNPGTWQTYNLGQTLAPGWTVTARSVDLYGNLVNKMPSGVCSVDLDGFQPGAIRSKAFATFPGATYTVTFLLSGNGGGPPAVKTIQIKAAGQSERCSTTCRTATARKTVTTRRKHGRSLRRRVTRAWSFAASM